MQNHAEAEIVHRTRASLFQASSSSISLRAPGTKFASHTDRRRAESMRSKCSISGLRIARDRSGRHIPLALCTLLLSRAMSNICAIQNMSLMKLMGIAKCLFDWQISPVVETIRGSIWHICTVHWQIAISQPRGCVLTLCVEVQVVSKCPPAYNCASQSATRAPTSLKSANDSACFIHFGVCLCDLFPLPSDLSKLYLISITHS